MQFRCTIFGWCHQLGGASKRSKIETNYGYINRNSPVRVKQKAETECIERKKREQNDVTTKTAATNVHSLNGLYSVCGRKFSIE